MMSEVDINRMCILLKTQYKHWMEINDSFNSIKDDGKFTFEEFVQLAYESPSELRSREEEEELRHAFRVVIYFICWTFIYTFYLILSLVDRFSIKQAMGS
jgi:hypothetical protein